MITQPRVVHCKREAYTHYIGRPSIFGNPYRIGPHPFGPDAARLHAIDCYWHWVQLPAQTRILCAIEALPANAVLGCWCKPQACHGNVILKLWRILHGIDSL